jgi:5-methylcytosine-specific restriction enzyme A
MRPCIDCGDPTTGRNGRCDPCRQQVEHTHDRARIEQPNRFRERGYDARWIASRDGPALSSRSVATAGPVTTLTYDHLPGAWEQKVITLADVDVVCRSCNGKRGAAR